MHVNYLEKSREHGKHARLVGELVYSRRGKVREARERWKGNHRRVNGNHECVNTQIKGKEGPHASERTR